MTHEEVRELDEFPPEAVLDEKQCAVLVGWPVEVFRAAVKHAMYPAPQLTYKGRPLWLARLQHINVEMEEL